MTAARVVGMMTVRDEEDILAESLSHAARMFDTVLVVDCGSLDQTKDIARRISLNSPNVHFLGSIPPATPMQVKRHIWNSFRHKFDWRDWWCIADADEFIDENYRNVLNSRYMRNCDHIIGEHVNFYYTLSEYLREKKINTKTLRLNSVRERRFFYRYHTKSLRFFRNLPWLRWNEDSSTPKYLSCASSKRIRFLHYQYRDPEQLQTRIRIRRAEYYRTDPVDKHWLKNDVYEALSADSDPNLTRYNGKDFIKDNSLKMEIKQPLPKIIANYMFNITMGYCDKSFDEKKFNF